MPTCRRCNSKFPYVVDIEGKKKNLQGRKFCLNCSPFKSHNTRPDGPMGEYLPNGRAAKCEECHREYPYNRSKGHSLTRCNSCIQRERQRDRKRELIDIKGGKCAMCGYDRCYSALQFHHVGSADKEFILGSNLNRKWKDLVREVEKCVLLCANCHAEEHAPLAQWKSGNFTGSVSLVQIQQGAK